MEPGLKSAALVPPFLDNQKTTAGTREVEEGTHVA